MVKRLILLQLICVAVIGCTSSSNNEGKKKPTHIANNNNKQPITFNTKPTVAKPDSKYSIPATFTPSNRANTGTITKPTSADNTDKQQFIHGFFHKKAESWSHSVQYGIDRSLRKPGDIMRKTTPPLKTDNGAFFF